MRILYVSELFKRSGGEKACWNLANAVGENPGIQAAEYAIGSLPDKTSIEVYPSSAKRSLSLRYVKDLRRVVIDFKPDIIHSMGFLTGLAALLCRKKSRIQYKIVMTLHHTSERFRLDFAAKMILAKLNKIDYITYLTAFQRDVYLRHGLNPIKWSLIPNIVTVKKPSCDSVRTLRKFLTEKTSSSLLLDYIGRLEQSKQLDVFIGTVAKLRNSGIDAGGVIVGTGPDDYLSFLGTEATRLGISQYISFEGFSDVPEQYISACDIGLFPTQWKEALPNFIIETFALGKTIVVSSIPQLSQVVKDKGDSLVAETHSTECYAEKILMMIENNGELKRKLEEGAKNSYSEKYSPEVVLKKYMEVYESLLQ